MNVVLKILIAGLLSLTSALAQAGETLYVSQWLPKSHPLYSVMENWQKAVTNATGGDVRFNVLPQPVAAPSEQYNAIRDGLADVSIAVLGYTPGRFPLTKLVEMPFHTPTAEANSVAFYKLAEQTPAIMKEFRNIKVLALFTHGPGTVFNTKRPVKTLADLQDLKFRVGGGVVNQVAQKLGVNASLKPATKSYELLANGVMDGVWLPFESLDTYNLTGLIKYATTFPGGLYSSTFIVMMNKDRWQSLSDADKRKIQALSGEVYSRKLGQAFDSADAETRKDAVKKGIEINQAPQELVEKVRERTQPLLDDWKKVARSKGVKDPDAIVKRYREDLGQ